MGQKNDFWAKIDDLGANLEKLDFAKEAKISQKNPAGVICEILKDDGTMARMPDLISFAQLHK